MDDSWPEPDEGVTLERFEPFSPADWEGQTPKPLDWVVDGCFQRGTVALFSGDGGLGKSLLLQQLATAAAGGFNWLGLPTKPSRTFALFCEDDKDELHRRQININRHYGVAMGDLEGLLYKSQAGKDSTLMRFGKAGDDGKTTLLFDQVSHVCRDFGADIIVLDTLADIFSGNEIDRNQPRVFIRTLRTLAMACNAVVIVTQHPSMSGIKDGHGMSGSTGWNNSVRSRVYLTRKKGEQGNDRILKTMKSNQGPAGGEVRITWQHGVFVTAQPKVNTPPSDWDELDRLPW